VKLCASSDRGRLCLAPSGRRLRLTRRSRWARRLRLSGRLLRLSKRTLANRIRRSLRGCARDKRQAERQSGNGRASSGSNIANFHRSRGYLRVIYVAIGATAAPSVERGWISRFRSISQKTKAGRSAANRTCSSRNGILHTGWKNHCGRFPRTPRILPPVAINACNPSCICRPSLAIGSRRNPLPIMKSPESLTKVFLAFDHSIRRRLASRLTRPRLAR